MAKRLTHLLRYCLVKILLIKHHELPGSTRHETSGTRTTAESLQHLKKTKTAGELSFLIR